ncbi:MAG: PglZ domain-containing protein [Intestinibacter bartlettii]
MFFKVFSCTKIMASLLPNKNITLDEKNNVYVDDISSEGTSNRENLNQKL